MDKYYWNKTQQKALRASILHWVRMRDNKRRVRHGYTRLLEHTSGRDCACCRNYNGKDDFDFDCMKCPIYLYSGYKYCGNSPFEEAHRAFVMKGHDSPQFKIEAEKQIIFMNKVLKAGTNA